MNPYLKNVSKLEFVVTNACTGRCKHCSAGERSGCVERIDPAVAADTVRRIAELYNLQTVMTFGGEPLLHPDAVCTILRTAADLRIPKRQVITNGYFSSDEETMREMADRLHSCCVNDLLLSVDAFHQETIPVETVHRFAEQLLACEIPTRLQPAWLVSPTDDNPYNCKTREVLACFSDLRIPVGEGNVVFPEGNARIHLAEYFGAERIQNPYEEDPRDVRCLSFSPNGDVLDGNVTRMDVLEILRCYAPKGGA